MNDLSQLISVFRILASSVIDNLVHDFILSIHVVLGLAQPRDLYAVVPCIITFSVQSISFLSYYIFIVCQFPFYHRCSRLPVTITVCKYSFISLLGHP